MYERINRKVPIQMSKYWGKQIGIDFHSDIMITQTHCHEKTNNQQSSLKGSVQISFWQGLSVFQGFIKALHLRITSGRRKGCYLSYKMPHFVGYRSLRSPLRALSSSIWVGSLGHHLPLPPSHGQQQHLGIECIKQKRTFMCVLLKSLILIWKSILCKHLFSPFFKGKVLFQDL